MSRTQIVDSVCSTFFCVISQKGSALFAIKLVDITPIDLYEKPLLVLKSKIPGKKPSNFKQNPNSNSYFKQNSYSRGDQYTTCEV